MELPEETQKVESSACVCVHLWRSAPRRGEEEGEEEVAEEVKGRETCISSLQQQLDTPPNSPVSKMTQQNSSVSFKLQAPG